MRHARRRVGAWSCGQELAQHLDVPPLFFSSVAQKGLQPLKDAIWKAIVEANPMLHNPHFQ